MGMLVMELGCHVCREQRVRSGHFAGVNCCGREV